MQVIRRRASKTIERWFINRYKGCYHSVFSLAGALTGVRGWAGCFLKVRQMKRLNLKNL